MSNDRAPRRPREASRPSLRSAAATYGEPCLTDSESAGRPEEGPERGVGQGTMWYVYLLRSRKRPDKTYVGMTDDVTARLAKHNDSGTRFTSTHRPWELVAFIAVGDRLDPSLHGETQVRLLE